MAKSYLSMSAAELQAELESVKKEYEDIKAQGLSIDMSRGKPGSDQLDISDGMLKVFDDGNFKCEAGLDVRNYGLLDGIPECKKLFADLLVMGIGEIIGGSQREERLDVLLDRIKELGLNEEDYWWYLDLRRYGGTHHAGFGLGFERLIMYMTGISNIRDVLPFPRTTGTADF